MNEHVGTFGNLSDGGAPLGLCESLCESGLFESEGDVIENYDALADMCRDYLESKGYTRAAYMMDIVIELKNGEYRDDDMTPSAVHELTQFIWMTSLIEDGLEIDHPEGAMINVLAHDLGEEFGMTPQDLIDMVTAGGTIPRENFPEGMGRSHDALSKYYDNRKEEKKDNDVAFTEIAYDRTASYVKVIDRLHNVISMAGVRDEQRAGRYLDSTEDNFVTKIYDFSYDAHPDQAPIYDSVLGMLNAATRIVDLHYNVDDEFPVDDDIEDMMPERGFKNLPRGLHPLHIVADRTYALQPERFGPPDAADTDDYDMP